MKNKLLIQLQLLCAVCCISLSASLFSCNSGAQSSDQRVEWKPIGIGGGGSMFSPAISPHDPNYAYVTCDMTGSMVTYDGGQSWRMFSLSHQVRYFVFDPIDPNVVYANSFALFKSEDKGLTWRLFYPDPAEVTGKVSKGDHAAEVIVTKDTTRRAVQAFAIDPASSKHLFAAISIDQTVAFFTSIDGGATWTKEKEFDHDVKNIYIDPSSPADQRTVYVAWLEGVEQRVNGQWQSYGSPDKDVKFNFFAGGYDSNTKKFVIYGISGKGYYNRVYDTQLGLYYTDNGGKTWENRKDGILSYCAPDLKTAEFRQLATSAFNPGTIYLAYQSLGIHADTTCFGIAKSTDFGKTWTLPWQDKDMGRNGHIVTPNFPGSWLDLRFGSGWCEIPHGMSISATDPNICYRADFGRIIKTMNGGDTWEEIYSKKLPDGSYTTRNVEVTTCYTIDFDPFDDNHLFITMTDVGLVESRNGGKGWLSATHNNGVPNSWVNTTYWLTFDPEVKGRIWTVMSLIHDLPRPKMWRSQPVANYKGGLLLSNDGGTTWQVVSQDIGEAAMTHILLDPTSKKDARTLYACAFGKGVYKSTDDGLTWTQKNNGIEGAEPFAWQIERRENDGTLFLVVSRRSEDGSIGDDRDGALYRSTDGAETWTKMKLPEGCNGPTSILTTKKYPKRIVLSAWGRATKGKFTPDEGGGIFISDDEGKTWTQVMGGDGILPSKAQIPDQHIHAVTFDPRNSRYYATGFNGSAYYSEDGAKTWTRIKGFNFKWGHRVIPDPHDSEMIYITTFGIGVWHGPAKGDPEAIEDVITPL